MSGYISLFLFLQSLVGLIPANQANKNGKSFWLWWFYGALLPVIAISHLNLTLEHKNKKEREFPLEVDMGKHAKNCSCDKCIFEYKRFASHTDWYDPFEEYDENLYLKKRRFAKLWLILRTKISMIKQAFYRKLHL